MEKGEIFDLWTVKMIRRRTLSMVRAEERVGKGRDAEFAQISDSLVATDRVRKYNRRRKEKGERRAFERSEHTHVKKL